MNHDIAHCNNEDCTAKNDCRRYNAHLEAVKAGMPYVPYLYCKELKNYGNNDKDIYATGRNAQSITPDDSRNDGSAADLLRDSEVAPMDDEKMKI